jgi:hypothetical protein
MNNSTTMTNNDTWWSKTMSWEGMERQMIHQLNIGKSPRPVGKNPLFKNPAKKELQEQDF